MTEGLGLRQVMDIYFVMINLQLNQEEIELLRNSIRSLGLERFSSGLLWILVSVLGMPNEIPFISLNQSEGEFLLSEIMQSGNFGYKDSRFGDSSSKVKKLFSSLRRTFHYISHYPIEVISSPFYYIWHFVWKRMILLTDKITLN